MVWRRGTGEKENTLNQTLNFKVNEEEEKSNAEERAQRSHQKVGLRKYCASS